MCPYCQSKQNNWIGECIYQCGKCQKPYIALLKKVYDDNPIIIALEENWQKKITEKFDLLQSTKTEHIKVNL